MVAALSTERDPRSLGNRPVDPNLPPPDGIPYRVKDFDSWNSVASSHGLDVWRLIEFNFKTRNPDVVNWYLREYVGCEQVSPDRHNWQFSGRITGGKGVWKGGIIYLPPDAFTFEGEAVQGQGESLLATRLPTESDRRAGRELFDEVATAAHKRAVRLGAIDESTINKLLSDGIDAFGVAEKVLEYAEEFGTLEIVGQLNVFVVLPISSAIQLVEILAEIGRANQVKDISQRRRTYYSALSAGIAVGLDPNYRPFVPRNKLLATVFEVGRVAMARLSVRKKRQLMVELIENYYFRTARGSRPRTVQEYQALMRGQIFDEAIMNRFEQHGYLWR